jgi:tRNA 2-selenouridine synthase
MSAYLDINQYLKSYQHIPLIDVRLPEEYRKGHIPGASNISLFSDTERAHVGTLYKKESREKAMQAGYRYVKPKLETFIKESRKIAPDN